MPLIETKGVRTKDLDDEIQFNQKSGLEEYSGETSDLSEVDYGLILNNNAVIAQYFIGDIKNQSVSEDDEAEVYLELADDAGNPLITDIKLPFHSASDNWFNFYLTRVWLNVAPGEYIFRVRQDGDADFREFRNIIVILNEA